MIEIIIVGAIAGALVRISQTLPAIIWSIRCPSDSRNFICPQIRERPFYALPLRRKKITQVPRLK